MTEKFNITVDDITKEQVMDSSIIIKYINKNVYRIIILVIFFWWEGIIIQERKEQHYLKLLNV